MNETAYDLLGYSIINSTSTSFWKHEQISEIEKDTFILNPVDISEGIYNCRKCGSGKVISIAKQVRSSDEGTSVFCTCVACNNKWREE